MTSQILKYNDHDAVCPYVAFMVMNMILQYEKKLI